MLFQVPGNMGAVGSEEAEKKSQPCCILGWDVI